MKKILKVAHVASFHGNIGDNASHNGFYSWIENINTALKIIWEKIEIRDFYRIRAYRNWDLDFLNYLNEFDAIIIGGGGYFELHVENSPSGCSIEFSPSQIEKIKKPIFFNSLGIDIEQGSKELNIKRFEEFLDSILHKKQNLISVRNDGSMGYLKKLYKDKYLNKIFLSPDNGFFSRYKPQIKNNITEIGEDNILLINIASDMPEKRFSSLGKDKPIEKVCQLIAKSILNLNNEMPIKVIFAPHIYKDIDISSKIISFLPDEMLREKISMAPYLSGFLGANEIFSNYYGRANLVWGSRFHSNICSIAQCKQTIGLLNYVQIENLYKELNQDRRLVNIRNLEFSDELVKKSLLMLNNDWKTESPNEALKQVNNQLKEFVPYVKEWLENIK